MWLLRYTLQAERGVVSFIINLMRAALAYVEPVMLNFDAVRITFTSLPLPISGFSSNLGLLFAAACHQPDIATSRSGCSRVSSQLLSAVSRTTDASFAMWFPRFPTRPLPLDRLLASEFAFLPMPHLCDYGLDQSGHSALFSPLPPDVVGIDCWTSCTAVSSCDIFTNVWNTL